MTSNWDVNSSSFSYGNIGIILGPQKSGKSYLIKKTLLQLENRIPKDKRLIIHIDLSSFGELSFDQFRQLFEANFVAQMSSQLSSDAVDSIQTVANSTFSPAYLAWLAKRSQRRIVNDEGMLRLPLQYRSKLRDLEETATLEDIASIVQEALEITPVNAWLLLLRDICLDSDAIDSQTEDLNVSGLKVVLYL